MVIVLKTIIMTIEINTDYLVKQKLTANQFVILQLVLEGELSKLEEFKGIYLEFSNDLEELKQRGLIIYDNGLHVSEQFLRSLKNKGFFEEFWMHYPVSVIRPDGAYCALRTARKQCERAYKKIAGRKDQHDHIIKCLMFEVKERERTDGMKWMKKMPNWINSEAWKEYEQKMLNADLFSLEEEKDKYGTTVI